METRIHTATHTLNVVDGIALTLLIIGGLNWGLVGVFDINLVQLIFGSVYMLPSIVYGLVGLSALYIVYWALAAKR